MSADYRVLTPCSSCRTGRIALWMCECGESILSHKISDTTGLRMACGLWTAERGYCPCKQFVNRDAA